MTTLSRIGRAVAAAGAAAALVGIAGCSIHAPQDGVQEQIKSQLGTDTAICPDDLDGTVGATMTCSATAAGDTFQVAVTVTSLQGSDINFDIKRVGAPADSPASLPPSRPQTQSARPTQDTSVDTSSGAVDGQEVAQAVLDQLTQIVGQAPDEVRCPDLPATVGAAIRCELDSGPDTYGVSVTTSSVQNGRVEFDILVDEQPS